jgi:prolyl-tRNA editing enzyme YbaK/EbsC (Cys-tRNA(Pro) deacylase)
MNSESLQQQVRRALEATGTSFEIIDCDPAYADTSEFCARYGFPLDHSGNTIVVASKRPPGRYAACVVLATNRLDVNKRVRDWLGVKKLSFASPEVTREVTGMMIGGVTPFALPPEIPLLIDARIMDLEWVILGGGDRSSKIKASPHALLDLPQTEVVEDLALILEG